MNEQELLQAIGQMIDEKLNPIQTEISSIKTEMKESFESVHEELSEIQTSLNIVVEWIDNAAQDKRLPPFASPNKA